jgi:hypothetical protein
VLLTCFINTHSDWSVCDTHIDIPSIPYCNQGNCKCFAFTRVGLVRETYTSQVSRRIASSLIADILALIARVDDLTGEGILGMDNY